MDATVDLRSLPNRRHIPSHPFIDMLRRSVAFDFFAVSGLDFDGYRFGSGLSIDTNVPPAYLDAYYGDGLLAVDPFVKASMSAVDVVIEERVYQKEPPPERILYLARTFGVLNRTLFPVRRGDILFGAVTFSRSNAFTDCELHFLGDVAEVTHKVLTRPIMEKFSAQTLRLSEGELLCVKLASFGKTSEEIAEASGYAPDTVNTYIRAATRKLGAKNRGHAIAEALRRGLIS
ncbi:autoinducer binding domain-containing protein [Rhizobium sp. NPDC090275]|uniref:autoinducer binding domain-containing protein n=1 Tax=Rhizobium sp. NPDC090275 TaxID=3364498 RepID=UPI00383B9720